MEWDYNYNGWNSGPYVIHIRLKDGSCNLKYKGKIIGNHYIDDEAAKASAERHKKGVNND